MTTQNICDQSKPHSKTNFDVRENESTESSGSIETGQNKHSDGMVQVKEESGAYEVEYAQERNVSAASRCRRCVGPSICLLLLIGTSITLLYFFVILEGDVNNLPQGVWDNIFDTDLFPVLPPEEASRWANSRQGLNILIVNALTARWYSYFDKAIVDWDNGFPDALTLRTEMASAPQPDCAPVQNQIVVCNKDYGPTGWKGRAEILSNGMTRTIIAASARVNEYYLSERNTDEMQYAICHELGHAFGLHHTDESFTNRNLGNCMDYTNSHRSNMQPDESNFVYLHALYGLVPGSRPFQPPTPAPTELNSVWQDPSQPFTRGGISNPPPTTSSGTKKNKDDRFLEQRASGQPQLGDGGRTRDEFPDWLMDSVLDIIKDAAISGAVELPHGFMLHIHDIMA